MYTSKRFSMKRDVPRYDLQLKFSTANQSIENIGSTKKGMDGLIKDSIGHVKIVSRTLETEHFNILLEKQRNLVFATLELLIMALTSKQKSENLLCIGAARITLQKATFLC